MGGGKGGVLYAYEDPEALLMLNEPAKPVHSYNPLIQIQADNLAAAGTQMEETHA